MSAAVADIVIGRRVWNALSINVGLTWASQVTDARWVSASVPSPVPGLSNPRTVSGIAPEIRRKELALHMNLALAVPAHSRGHQVAIFAGPSWFWVNQGLVTGVTVNEYVTVHLRDIRQRHRDGFAEAQRIGANAGIEASVRVWKGSGSACWSATAVRCCPLNRRPART